MQTTSPANSSRQRRILVADDDPLNLRIAARLLKELGHTGALVTNGEKVLEILQKQPFDLILLDVNMPVLDVWGTLRALRKLEHARHRHIPVLMVSGDDTHATAQHFMAAGADGFLVKPISLEGLRTAINNVRSH